MTFIGGDHPDLVVAADDVCGELARFEDRLDRYDKVDHEQHRVHVARGVRLGMHLESALRLSRDGLHAGAFALLRTALEHHMADLLLHKGGAFEEITRQVTDEEWAEILATYEAQEERWTRQLLRPPERTSRGRIRYTFRGIVDKDTDPAEAVDVLHPLYFEAQRYRATTARSDAVEYFDDGILDPDLRRREADRNHARWRRWVSWAAIRRNLEINELYDDGGLRAIDVHYAFLSGFTHATDWGYEEVYGNHWSIDRQARDHYAEELVTLYAITFGAAELRLLCDMEGHPPPIRITGRDEIEAVCARAEAVAEYLWFAGGRPHRFDFVTEMNRRGFRKRLADEPFTMADVEPAVDQVGYYLDPLARLRKMHQTFTEGITGITYTSPWRYPGPPW